jgi:hypothetical protein
MAVSKQETTCNAARQAGSTRQTSPLTPLQTGTETLRLVSWRDRCPRTHTISTITPAMIAGENGFLTS